MKYVLLGKLNAEWLTRTAERVASAKAKLAALDITIDTYYFTQGDYDFVDVVDADDVGSVLAFSVWYAQQGYGSITTMPAFTGEEFEAALAKL